MCWCLEKRYLHWPGIVYRLIDVDPRIVFGGKKKDTSRKMDRYFQFYAVTSLPEWNIFIKRRSVEGRHQQEKERNKITSRKKKKKKKKKRKKKNHLHHPPLQTSGHLFFSVRKRRRISHPDSAFLFLQTYHRTIPDWASILNILNILDIVEWPIQETCLE